MRLGDVVRWNAWWLVAALCMLSAPAFAQTELAEEQARAHFNTGSVAFSAGRYADALDEFKKAYALSHRPKLLYNIGVASDRLRHDQEALDAFEQYLQQVPDAPERPEIEGRLTVLRAAVAQQRAAAAPTVAPSPADAAHTTSPPAAPVNDEPTTATASSSAAPWVLLIGSGAVAVTGGVLLALALSDKAAVRDAKDNVSLDELEGPHDRVPVFSAVGGVMLGVGVLGASIATAWLVLGGSSESDAPVQAQVGVGAISVRGRF